MVQMSTSVTQDSEGSNDVFEINNNKTWTISESRTLDLRQEYLNVNDGQVDSLQSTDTHRGDTSSLSQETDSDNTFDATSVKTEQ